MEREEQLAEYGVTEDDLVAVLKDGPDREALLALKIKDFKFGVDADKIKEFQKAWSSWAAVEDLGVTCQNCDEVCRESWTVQDGDLLCDECFRESYTYCEGCNEIISYEGGDLFQVPDSCDPLCEDCYFEAMKEVEPDVAKCDGDDSIKIRWLGKVVPDGWENAYEKIENRLVSSDCEPSEELVEYFVDSSGFGSDNEPAMTYGNFIKQIKKGRAYGISDRGQFQVYVREFVRKGVK